MTYNVFSGTVNPTESIYDDIVHEFGEITHEITSFKVIEFGTNRKLLHDFLLVINTNLLPILHRFRDIAFDRSKIAIFG